MANMSNIVDFNNSDGLPPDVIKKLNNNVFQLAQKISDPQIVMVSGVEFPDPRTDETLFYKTDTGDLYIWAHVDEGSPDEWEWLKIDLSGIHVDTAPPGQSQYNRRQEFLWFDVTHETLYIWTQLSQDPGASWYTIPDIINDNIAAALDTQDGHDAIYSMLINMTKIEWTDMPKFCAAVKDIIANPNDF